MVLVNAIRTGRVTVTTNITTGGRSHSPCDGGHAVLHCCGQLGREATTVAFDADHERIAGISLTAAKTAQLQEAAA